MALVDIGTMLYPVATTGTTSTAIRAINGTSTKAAFVFYVPKTGTIDRLCFASKTVTTAATMDVRLETVGADGLPTGTLVAPGANGAQLVNTANTWYETTLTTPVAVSVGDLVALVIVNNATPGVFNLAIAAESPTSWRWRPYTIGWGGSFWTILGDNAPMMMIRYNDTTYPYIAGVWPLHPNIPMLSVDFGTASTPDEIGCRIILPMGATCAGAFWESGTNSLDDFTLTLYDASNTVLASRLIDKDPAPGSNVVPALLRWSAPVLLVPGTYRITLKPSTTTERSYLRQAYVSAAAYMAAMPNGISVIRTHRTDSGAWTQTTTNRPNIGLWLSEIHDGAVGASGSSYAFAG